MVTPGSSANEGDRCTNGGIINGHHDVGVYVLVRGCQDLGLHGMMLDTMRA